MRGPRTLVREAWAVTRAERVGTALILVVVVAMCVSVILTTGRSIGSERAVLSSIDGEGVRTIVVRADPQAEIDSTVVGRIRTFSGVEWVGAFGPAQDVQVSTLPEPAPVAMRTLASTDDGRLHLGRFTIDGPSGEASADALRALGLLDPSGDVTTTDGEDVAVTGRLDVPSFLAFLQPLVVQRTRSDQVGPAAVIVVLARSARDVEPVATQLPAVLDASDAKFVSIQTSHELVVLHRLVEGQLGGFSRALVALVFVILSVVVAALLYGLIMMRRKDYGRRRALGATRRFVVGLVVARTVIPAAAGAAAGTGGAVVVLRALGDPLPDVGFCLGLGILALAAAAAGAVVPAIAASRRDPLSELRVP
ncbi:hypothetical protein GCM10023221_00210 [Luteimicrobium xylanilyticum]|uniref:ABC3 transporter permease C-terminal domain-containing protein n=1 Tax=Luteimicrobium xylanilyticum TaxID=1133546 RepID=A0A5P9Q8C0_9MICO|nr:hypothetical protein KDY119_01180 [Luteimicrobium xylanilyticum]